MAYKDGDGAGTAVRILDAAERMLQVKGYNGFSYGDVATELGITRAALHYHYPGKAELGQALIERYAARFAAALGHLDVTAPSAAAKLRGYADLYIDVLSADRMCLCGMLAAEHRTLPDPLQQAVCDFFTSNATWLSAVLQEGLADGSVSVTGTVDDTAAMILGGLEGGMLVTRLDGDVVRFTATVERLLATITATPAPPPEGLSVPKVPHTSTKNTATANAR